MTVWRRRCPRFAITQAGTSRTGLQLVPQEPVATASIVVMFPVSCGRMQAIRQKACADYVWRQFRDE